MRNEVLLERIRKWQEEPIFHELTCGNDSNHSLLKGAVENNEVVLVCEDCNYKQTYIPELFFAKEFDEMYEQQRKLIERLSSK